MSIHAFVIDPERFYRYGKAISDILTHDAPFQRLIKQYGKEMHERAIDIIVNLTLLAFVGQIPAHEAADEIRDYFYSQGKHLEAEQAAYYEQLLNSIPLDKTH